MPLKHAIFSYFSVVVALHALQVGPKDKCYDEYPELGIEDWHKKHGVYMEEKGGKK